MPLTHSLSRRIVVRSAIAAAGVIAAGHGAGHAQNSRRPGDRGIRLLRRAFAGRLQKRPVPLSWNVHVPVRGTGFYYPADWAVTEVVDPNPFDLADGNPSGSLVIAPDESAAVLLLNQTWLAPISSTDFARFQLAQALETEAFEPLAEDEHQLGLGVTMTVAAGRTAAVVGALSAQAMPDQVTGGTFTYLQLVVAEPDIFDDVTDDVFLPLLQNQVTAGGSECDTDPDDDDDPSDYCPSFIDDRDDD